MIFDTLDTLPTHFGSKRKVPAVKQRYRSNMMLNPLNLKHLNRMDNHDSDMITLNQRKHSIISRFSSHTWKNLTLSSSCVQTP